MNFLAPMMLAGAAAVSIPVALHFFYKARHRPLPWGAMEFLRQSIEQTSRRLKFQEWILLALRCLCLLLLALAMARPSCSTLNVGGGIEGVDAIFLFDTSYSMGASDGEETRFDRAKNAAISVLDSLPANSTVQVVTSALRAEYVGPQSPGNLDQARQLISNLKLTSQSGDTLAAFEEALAAMDRGGAGGNKEVYLFTDIQKSGWESQAGAIRDRAEEIKQRATLIIVRCGSPDRTLRNVAIREITFPSGIPHSGSRLPVTVLLNNTGVEPVENLTVTLEVNGKSSEAESNSVQLVEPGQTTPVTLTANLAESGPTLLTARVQSDDLPGDNQYDRLISVRERVRVLVIDGRPNLEEPTEAGSHYVVNALIPVPANQRDDYFVRVNLVTPDEASPALLSNADVCVLCDVPATSQDVPGTPGLSEEFLQRLARFVADGGGLLIGSGDNVIPESYNEILGDKGLKLLPFQLGAERETDESEPFHPAPDTTEAPGFLARFKETPYSTVTADVELFRVTDQSIKANSGGRVVMRLSNGMPWITARVVGEGEVLFVGSGWDERWGNWPARGGSYLSFFQSVLSHLVGKGSRGTNLVAGQPLVFFPTEAEARFDLIEPDGERVPLGQPALGSGNKLTLTHPDTKYAGVYRVVLEGAEPSRGPQFAVIPDLTESDNLASLTEAELEQLLGFRPVLVFAGKDASATLAAERSRRELTIWLLLLLFMIAGAEAGWAWFCGRAW